MPVQTILKLYIRGWLDTVSLLRRPIVLVPFLVLALLKLLPLLCLSFFSYPLVASFSVPAIRSIFGEQALHYPQHVLMLSDMYRTVDITVLLLFGFTMYGWAVFMMADTLQGKRIRLADYGLQVVWSIPSFLLIGVLFVLITFGIPLLLEQVTDVIDRRRMVQLLTLMAIALWASLIASLIYSLFFLKYVPEGPMNAIARSVRFTQRRFAVTVVTLLTVLVLHAPGHYLLSRFLTPHIGMPDPLLPAIIVKLLFDIVAGYYLFAATTSLAVGKRKER